jgi:short-subunit dehydrogenase
MAVSCSNDPRWSSSLAQTSWHPKNDASIRGGSVNSEEEPSHAEAFRSRYGPAAIVTGAAQGIGRAFADSLAARGLSVYLLDVRAEAVAEAAREVESAYPVRARPIVVDLSRRDFLPDLLKATEGEGDLGDVGLVVCNAAIGQEGPFLSETIDDLHRAVDVNCQSTLTLAHHFGRRMTERGRGGLLLVASGTALQGSPNYSNYAATKAFNLVLGESLWYEFQEHGVDVLSFVPGPTNTPGLRKSMPGLEEGTEVGPIRLPSTTAESALAALGKHATAARQPGHSNRLAVRRRKADELIERQQRGQRGSEGGARD